MWREPETYFYVGMGVAPHAKSPTQVTITFRFTDPDVAAVCLRRLVSRTAFGDALALAASAGYAYNSANAGEPQLQSMAKDSDFWACVFYDGRKHRTAAAPVVYYGRGVVKRVTFGWDSPATFLNAADHYEGLDCLFSNLMISSLAG